MTHLQNEAYKRTVNLIDWTSSFLFTFTWTCPVTLRVLCKCVRSHFYANHALAMVEVLAMNVVGVAATRSGKNFTTTDCHCHHLHHHLRRGFLVTVSIAVAPSHSPPRSRASPSAWRPRSVGSARRHRWPTRSRPCKSTGRLPPNLRPPPGFVPHGNLEPRSLVCRRSRRSPGTSVDYH